MTSATRRHGKARSRVQQKRIGWKEHNDAIKKTGQEAFDRGVKVASDQLMPIINLAACDTIGRIEGARFRIAELQHDHRREMQEQVVRAAELLILVEACAENQLRLAELMNEAASNLFISEALLNDSNIELHKAPKKEPEAEDGETE